jgi:hypothetical protein
MKPTHYEITVRGRIGDTLTGAFAGLTADPADAQTVFRGVIADRSALYGVLDRMESFGLELLDVRRTVSP